MKKNPAYYIKETHAGEEGITGIKIYFNLGDQYDYEITSGGLLTICIYNKESVI
jgi:hypothetical protein